MKIKKIFIYVIILIITISCNNGDNYLGNWYNKNYKTHLYISKAGNKGYIIRSYRTKSMYYENFDKSDYFIFDDGYFYLNEENRNKNIPTFIVKDKNQIVTYNGILYSKI
jgi:hypothetical protein